MINGERADSLRILLDRLQIAKRKVDDRIAVLGGADNSVSTCAHGVLRPSVTLQSIMQGPSMIHGKTSGPSPGLGLREVLSSPNSLSYFMEYMDRRQRSLLIQFWLTVESFKDPLESASYELDTADTTQPSPSSNASEDITLIYDLYFSGQGSVPTPVLRAVSPRHVDSIRSFVTLSAGGVGGTDEGDAPPSSDSTPDGSRARQAVLLAQKQVEEAMGDDFEDFKQSELWHRVAAEYAHARHGLVASASDVAFPPAHANTLVAPNAHPVPGPRPPSVRSHAAPARRPSASANRAYDNVRSRIYPSFILPATTDALPPTTTTNDDFPESTSSGRPLPPRLRVQSPVSDPGSASPTTTSPVLSGSVDSLLAPSTPPPFEYRNALDFLTSDPSLPPATSETGTVGTGRAPLFDDPEIIAEETARAERMEAIQAALTDLIADESHGGGLFSGEARDEGSGAPSRSTHGKPKGISPATTPELTDGTRSCTYSASDVHNPAGSAPPSRGATGTTKDFEIEEDFTERPNVPVAAPGHLLLSHDVARLTDKISKLQSQEVMLEVLTRKAELTGDVNELRLLSRSKASLSKEIREVTFQKTQLEQQEKDNRLIPGCTRITIASSSTTEQDGKQIIRYLVDVQQLGAESQVQSNWTVSRRYNEFFAMHQRLKERYTSVRNLDFPGKRLVTSLSSSFVDTRRLALEKYLQVSTQASYK